MSRHPRHPYQSAAACGHAPVRQLQPAPHLHQGLRNPWAGEENHSQSTTNSSSSSRTCRGPAPPWLCSHQAARGTHDSHNAQYSHNAHHSHNSHNSQNSHVDAVIQMSAATGCSHAAALLQKQQQNARAVIVPASERERPVTPASSPAGSGSGGAVSGCGGHCEAFDNFCYYCLQMVFVAGILTGVSLTIAGSVLRSQRRGGDLMVLVYIGFMVAMVCGLLLSVQCCVRRNVKRRRRALRRPSRQQQQQQQLLQQQDGIPLQELARAPASLLQQQEQQQQQEQPVYQPVRVVHQQPADNQRLQYHHHNAQHRPVLCTGPGPAGVNSNDWLYRRVMPQASANDNNIAIFESENLGTRLRYYHDI